MAGTSQAMTACWQKGRVTAPGKLSADLQPGTLKSILRQAGLKD
jgi:predicted RNA binding protein YcfA (HicA-like mRNA interferase family)